MTGNKTFDIWTDVVNSKAAQSELQLKSEPQIELHDIIESNYDEDYDEDEDYPMPNSAANERTLVMLKPDAFERGLVGEVMSIVDRRGLRLIGAKQFTMTPTQAQKHYKHHLGKDFWPQLEKFMTSGPCFALVYEGESACAVVRQLIGQKHPSQSPPGSIRGRYAMEFPKNLIHGSDYSEEAEQEIKLYFDESELFGSKFVQIKEKEAKEKKAKFAVQKKEQLANEPSVGDFILWPQHVKAGDIIMIDDLPYSVESRKKMPGIDSYRFQIQSLKAPWTTPLNLINEEDGFAELKWKLVKRGDETMKGFKLPVVNEFALLNPQGTDITSGTIPGHYRYSEPHAKKYLVKTASIYANEIVNNGPFILMNKNTGEKLWVSYGNGDIAKWTVKEELVPA